jgi:glycine/serine hydroxymethyltransferase
MKFNGSGLVMGTYEVALRCPDCEEVAMVGVELTTVLTHASDESATLKLRAKSTKMVHACGQPTLFDEP